MEKGGKEILVVDDEKRMRDLLVKVLSKDGYIVHTAEDGETAIAMIKESLKDNIDLILLDKDLPGITGIDTLQQIKKIRKDLSVIIISAAGLTVDETKILAGTHTYLSKPFKIDKLREIVKKTVGK